MLFPPTAWADDPPSFILTWGSLGDGDGQFDYPSGIAIDANGNVYVVDAGNGRIQKFTSDGTFLTKWDTRGDIEIAFDSNDNVYVVSLSDALIQKYTSDGTFLTKWGTIGNGEGEWLYPWCIAIDSNNNVYVGDQYR